MRHPRPIGSQQGSGLVISDQPADFPPRQRIGEATSRLVAQRQPALYRIALNGPAKSETFLAVYMTIGEYHD
jgi:hypothetical protein